MRIGRILLLISVILSAGCVTTPSVPADLIQGSWQSTLAGFTVTSIYTDAEVTVDGHKSVSYALDGDRLVVGNDNTMVRVVSFPSSDEMIQLDPLTNTEHLFTRSPAVTD